jgi:hypothetical protein
MEVTVAIGFLGYTIKLPELVHRGNGANLSDVMFTALLVVGHPRVFMECQELQSHYRGCS